MDVFITKLMESMTLQEKIVQFCLVSPAAENGMNASGNFTEILKSGKAGGMYVFGNPRQNNAFLRYADSTRLKIPFFNALDIIHGYKTVFPCPLGLSCTWNPDLIEKTAHVAAVEATAAGYNWTFSPMADLTRNPRWGRVMEGSGEDPYLGGLIAAAMVKGYQQNGLLACVKHFALYGASEAGRDYNITDMSRLTMFQHYLPPYTSALTPPVLTFNHSIFPALQYRNHFPVLRRHYKTAQNTGCWRKA
jgi:beta-glucosidase